MLTPLPWIGSNKGGNLARRQRLLQSGEIVEGIDVPGRQRLEPCAEVWIVGEEERRTTTREHGRSTRCPAGQWRRWNLIAASTHSARNSRKKPCPDKEHNQQTFGQHPQASKHRVAQGWAGRYRDAFCALRRPDDCDQSQNAKPLSKSDNGPLTIQRVLALPF
jgi:hypothetical protein